MNLKTRAAALFGALALLLTPAAALAAGAGAEYAPDHPDHPAHPTHPAQSTPGPKAPLPQLAKAYGVHCRTFSKTHVKGEKSTPFSNCVKAMAIAANSKKTAKAACKALPKKHVKGQKGTEFSRCVVAAAKVKKEATAG